MRVHVVFIGLGLFFLVIGMLFGVWMGVNHDFQFAAAHAHWNLVGFVTSSIYGLTHRAYPRLADSRLTWFQCGLHVVGVLIFAPGIVLAVATGEQMAAIVGANVLIAAALMFMFIYFTHDHSTTAD
ncbi:MAG: hypothetical protein ABL973_12175 [Micropepsaceae bacterium]